MSNRRSFRSDTLRFKAWYWPCGLMYRLALFSHVYLFAFRPKKDETAVHCCDPALSVLVIGVSKFFHLVSALQSIVCQV